MNLPSKDSALNELWRGRFSGANCVTPIFYLILIINTLFLASLPVCPWARRAIMEKFHLKSPSIFQFSLLQFVPSMYSFANEFLVSTQRIPGGLGEATKARHAWVNHYPLRYATFGMNIRQPYFQDGLPRYYYARSRYRGEEMDSLYVIKKEGGVLMIRREQ